MVPLYNLISKLLSLQNRGEFRVSNIRLCHPTTAAWSALSDAGDVGIIQCSSMCLASLKQSYSTACRVEFNPEQPAPF